MRLILFFAALSLLTHCGRKESSKKAPADKQNESSKVEEQGVAIQKELQQSNLASSLEKQEASLKKQEAHFIQEADQFALNLPPYLYEATNDLTEQKIFELQDMIATLETFINDATTYVADAAADDAQATTFELKKRAAGKAIEFLNARIAIEDLRKQKRDLANYGLKFHVVFHPGKNERDVTGLSDIPTTLSATDLAAFQEKLAAFTDAADALAENPSLNVVHNGGPESMADMLRHESSLAKYLTVGLRTEPIFTKYGVTLYETVDTTRLQNFNVSASYLKFLSNERGATEAEIAEGERVAAELETYSQDLSQLKLDAATTAKIERKAKAAKQAAELIEYRALAYRFWYDYKTLTDTITIDPESASATWNKELNAAELKAKQEQLAKTKTAYQLMVAHYKTPMVQEWNKAYQSNNGQRQVDALQQIAAMHNENWLNRFEEKLCSIQSLMN